MSFHIHNLPLLYKLIYVARGLKVTKNAYFSLLTHIRQLLLAIFFATTVEIGGVTEHLHRVDGLE